MNEIIDFDLSVQVSSWLAMTQNTLKEDYWVEYEVF